MKYFELSIRKTDLFNLWANSTGNTWSCSPQIMKVGCERSEQNSKSIVTNIVLNFVNFALAYLGDFQQLTQYASTVENYIVSAATNLKHCFLGKRQRRRLNLRNLGEFWKFTVLGDGPDQVFLLLHKFGEHCLFISNILIVRSLFRNIKIKI